MRILRVIKELVRHVPFCGAVMARIYGRQHRGKSVEKVFTDIFHTSGFKGKQSLSGPGSDPDQTHSLRKRLPELFEQFKVRHVVDAPCGDFLWMKEIVDELDGYIGVDIVSNLIEDNTAKYGSEKIAFMQANIATSVLPKSDIILCRDCMVHLPFNTIFAALMNFKMSGTTYLLATTYPETRKHIDIIPGLWRPLNLCRKPFCFPEPLTSILEESTEAGGQYGDKTMGLWKLDDLPGF